ncbi:hypothetical protein [Pelagibacterium halotolerans]|uniref:calcium-binding protein n=1 Tax=Pelagibacterium halotolerans TaxID=531813 RepID=UPI00384B3C05
MGDPVYCDGNRKPTQGELEELVAPLIDGVAEEIFQDGAGSSRALNFSIRNIGGAETIQLAFNISFDGDDWWVNGAKFVFDHAGGQGMADVIAWAATLVASAVLGAATAPAWLGVVINVGAAVAGALVWDAIDDAVGISEAVEAFFGQQDVDVQISRDGTIIAGALYDNLSEANYEAALKGLVDYASAVPGDTIEIVSGATGGTTYRVLEGNLMLRMAQAMGTTESEFKSWVPDPAKPDVTNGSQIIDHQAKDVLIAMEDSTLRLKIFDYDGNLEDINVAFKQLGIGGAPSEANANGLEIIIGTSDGIEQLSSSSGNGACIIGGVGSDDIIGTGADDRLFGDDVYGKDQNGGFDWIYAGAGNDYVSGGWGDDTILGQDGDDKLIGGTGADTIDGGDGDDIIYGDTQIGSPNSEGAGFLMGGTGADKINGGVEDDLIIGGSLKDGTDHRMIDKASFLDNLDLAQNHSEWDDGSRDELRGGAGHDVYLSSSSSRFAYTWSKEALSSVDFVYDSDNDFTAHFQITRNDTLCDTLTITAEDLAEAPIVDGCYELGTVNVITFGGERSDVSVRGELVTSQDYGKMLLMTATHGAYDVFVIGAFSALNLDPDKSLDLNDRMYGSDDADVLYAGNGNDAVYAYGGGDTIVAGHGQGADYYDGGDGSDTVTFTSTSAGITVDLARGVASGVEIDNDILVSIENAIGGAGNDMLIGSLDDNALAGGGGNDVYVYNRGGGHDVLVEGAGQGAADELVVNGVNGTTETHITAIGADLLIEIYESAPGAGDGGSIVIKDQLRSDGDFGVETIEDGFGNTWTKQDIIDFLYPDGEGITVDGSSGDDDILGSVKDDSLYGGAGNDTIRGLDGADTLSGDSGNDLLEGGAGDDWLLGGEGNDTFVFGSGTGEDGIGDFEAHGGTADGDVIELHGQSASTFEYLMANAEEWGGNSWLHLDDGDLVILYGVGLSQLSADDFRFVA